MPTMPRVIGANKRLPLSCAAASSAQLHLSYHPSSVVCTSRILSHNACHRGHLGWRSRLPLLFAFLKQQKAAATTRNNKQQGAARIYTKASDL